MVNDSHYSNKEAEDAGSILSNKDKFLLLLLCLMPMFTMVALMTIIGSVGYFLMYFAYGEDHNLTFTLLIKVGMLVAVIGLLLSSKNLYNWYKLIRSRPKDS